MIKVQMLAFGMAEVGAMRECSDRTSKEVAVKVVKKLKIWEMEVLLSFTDFWSVGVKRGGRVRAYSLSCIDHRRKAKR